MSETNYMTESVQSILNAMLNHLREQDFFDLIEHFDLETGQTVSLYPLYSFDIIDPEFAKIWDVFFYSFLNECDSYVADIKSRNYEPGAITDDDLEQFGNEEHGFFTTSIIPHLNEDNENSFVIALSNPDWIRNNFEAIQEYSVVRLRTTILSDIEFVNGRYKIGPFRDLELNSICQYIHMCLTMVDKDFVFTDDMLAFDSIEETYTLYFDPDIFEKIIEGAGVQTEFNNALKEKLSCQGSGAINLTGVVHTTSDYKLN